MINIPYVLFTRIPFIKSDLGKLYCNKLWAKDLSLHLDYISNFSICCPVVYSNEISDLEDITSYNISNIYEFKYDYGYFSVIKNAFPTFFIVIKSCLNASIVHSDGSGWPFPMSFYLLLVRPFFLFKWIVIIESSFWMLNKNEKKTLKKIINYALNRILLPLCVKYSDARIFTQSYYRKFFLEAETERTLIAPATWIDKDNLLSPNIVKNRRDERQGEIIKIIFAARLVESKGTFVLLKAIELLKSLDVTVSITIIGSGSLDKVCKSYVLQDFGSVKVFYREPVQYGIDFFNMLCEYDVVVIPNLNEEQPRIIFDAFSQGLPVIASDTTGILDIAKNGENAVICKRGDPVSLSNAICYLVENKDIILRMGLSGLSYVEGKTHLQMHLDRKKFLDSNLFSD